MSGVQLGQCLATDHAACPRHVKLPHKITLLCGCDCHKN